MGQTLSEPVVEKVRSLLKKMPCYAVPLRCRDDTCSVVWPNVLWR